MVEAPASPPSSQKFRPPTPPRESIKRRVEDNQPASDIFPTPTSSLTTPCEATRKRVEWSPWTDYQEHPDKSSKQSSAFLSKLAPLPPSGERKPSRSILKSRNVLSPRDSNDRSQPSPPRTYENLPAMLESSVRQLATDDRNTRIAAYKTLSTSLRSFDDAADLKALREKMGLLSQFIQRDLHAKTDNDVPDATLINNALILLSSLLYGPELFDNDFGAFAMDYAINAFETGNLSKDTMNRLVFMVDHQNFTARVMNAERVGRLINALHEIEKHARGKAIIMGRISIYLRLLKQAKSSMITNTIWIEDMLHDMVSSFSDTRSQAVHFATQASLLLGTEAQTSKALHEIFKAKKDNNRFVDFYAETLRKLLKSKDDCKHVPQIWVVILLFLRHRPRQIEQWELMIPWLVIIQECFNSGEMEVRKEATRAWNRFVFAVRPDEKTTASMVAMLFSPIVGQLNRKLKTKNVAAYRAVIIGCVCNLLYYAFRPNISHQRIDRYWEAYVVQLMGLPFKANDGKAKGESLSRELPLACSILKGLLDTTPKVWNENRANQSEPLTPVDLPSLDGQWIRKNTQKVLAVMEPLITASFSDLSKPDSPISELWNIFCEALKAAGVKEIKVSSDTMNSIAQIMSMLYRIWSKELSNSGAEFFRGFGYLVSSMISKLGVLPFTEKLLSLGTGNTFELTPSHRTTLVHGTTRCSLHHLVVLISNAPESLLRTEQYVDMVKKLLSPFYNSRESRVTRLGFLQEINELLPGQSLQGDLLNAPIWEVISEFAREALERVEESKNPARQDVPNLGPEYGSAGNILEAGLGSGDSSTLQAVHNLFQAFTRRVKEETGDSGVAIAVIEPLAKALVERRAPISTKLICAYCTFLATSARYPKDQHSLDAARRRILGSSTSRKSALKDPYDMLYRLVSLSLKSAYFVLEFGDSKTLLLEASAMLERCPEQHLVPALEKLQEGLSCWVADVDHKLVDPEAGTTFSDRIFSAIRRLSKANSATLDRLSYIISSGLESRHKLVASGAILTWNSTFGNQSSIDYTPAVLQALARLRSIAELKLPSFPDTLPADFETTPPEFFESQDHESVPAGFSNHNTPSSTKAVSNARRKSASKPVAEVKQSRKRRFEGTSESRPRKQARGQLTPKLRHDDSQVQFEAIVSSPMSDAVMDSQLLTDRQKEVKERQRTDATMFRDFGSSPQPIVNGAGPKLSMKSNTRLLHGAVEEEEPATPTINPGASNMFYDDYITSSPTPRRGDAVLPDSDALEPPSSPPEKITIQIPSSPPKPKSTAASNDYDETTWDITVGSQGILQPKVVADTPHGQCSGECTDANGKGLQPPSTPVQIRMEQMRHNPSPVAESEVFMDAVSSPSKMIPGKPQNKNSIQPQAVEPSVQSVQETPMALQQGSQGRARNIFNAAWKLPNSLKSFISPPKQKTPAQIYSSPLDEDSVLRIMNQIDQPQKEKETPSRISHSQPAYTNGEDADPAMGYSSDGGSKKRKRVSSMSHVIEATQQSLSQRDSQVSWMPSQDTDTQSQSVDNSQPINKVLFPSTVPETPVAQPGALAFVGNGNISAGSSSRRPFTRSTRRLQLAGNSTHELDNDGSEEMSSGRIPGRKYKARKSNKVDEITAGVEISTQDLEDMSRLDSSHDDGTTKRYASLSAAPKNKSRLSREVEANVEAEGHGGEETSSDNDFGKENAGADGASSTPDEESISNIDFDDVDVVDEEEMSEDEPSQQLLRDTDENSQRVRAALEMGNEMISPPISESQLKREKKETKMSVAKMGVKEHLQAALGALRGMSGGVERSEGVELEEMLLGLRRELIDAEERGRSR